jgi:flagellar basal body-associated protein FliL
MHLVDSSPSPLWTVIHVILFLLIIGALILFFAGILAPNLSHYAEKEEESQKEREENFLKLPLGSRTAESYPSFTAKSAHLKASVPIFYIVTALLAIGTFMSPVIFSSNPTKENTPIAAQVQQQAKKTYGVDIAQKDALALLSSPETSVRYSDVRQDLKYPGKNIFASYGSTDIVEGKHQSVVTISLVRIDTTFKLVYGFVDSTGSQNLNQLKELPKKGNHTS